MRCFLFISIRDHLIEFGCFQHQRFLTVTSCRQNLQGIQITAFFFISVQDRFDTNGCIQNIRTGISFKRCKSFNIKNIIFGCLVGQVSVFDCRKSYDFCSRSCITPPSLVLNGFPSFPFMVPKPRNVSLVSSFTIPAFLAQRNT